MAGKGNLMYWLLLGGIAWFGPDPVQAQLAPHSAFNYDEAKVGEYTLPELLQLQNGKRVTSSRQWEKERRPELLALFQQEVFGLMPGKPRGMHFVVNEVAPEVLGGLATRKQVTIYFSPGTAGPSLDLLIYLPRQVKGPVPAFVGLNYFGNQSIHPDPGIRLSERWMRNTENKAVVQNRATASSRGLQASRWPVEEMMRQGFALVTAYYGDLEPDHPEGWKNGIRSHLKAELGLQPEQWGAIGAWAWGLSRIMDYLQTEPAINPHQIALTGHSRLGKAALWAGANDTRFALVVSNDSGEGGAALARRNYGETVARLNEAFPHWFSPAYRKYNHQPDRLPVDAHSLLALIAPRPLYVNSAQEDQWADPKGEFLGAWHTGPVYQLYQKTGLKENQMPAVSQPVGDRVGYHIRPGKHDINAYDWEQHLAFARKHFQGRL